LSCSVASAISWRCIFMCCQIIKLTFSAADVLPPQRKNAGKLRCVN
jgi:hypothetical protein